MQAALCFVSKLPTSTPTKISATMPRSSPSKIRTAAFTRNSQFKTRAVALEATTVDYNSEYSVFPAEACDTLGNEACRAGTFPEVKLKQEEKRTVTTQELIDREYLEYNDSKTVFREEACDDLGGEFCQPGY